MQPLEKNDARCHVFPIGNKLFAPALMHAMIKCVFPIRSIERLPGISTSRTSMSKPGTASPQAIAEFVKSRRSANGLTQRELGELAEVGTRLISDLERGKPTTRLDAVNRVLAVFGQMLGPVEAPRDDD